MLIWNPWKEIKRLRHQLSRAKHNETLDLGEILRLLDRADKLHIGLRDIIAEEKPTSNATVKRMARMAREAIK